MSHPRLKRLLFWTAYLVVVVAVVLAVLEFAARSLGLGQPIIYYNAAVAGMRPLPGQQSARLKGATVTVDDNGFRSAQVPDRPALKILYLGDSVTWGGSAVDDSELFSEVSADVLRRAGMSVYAMNAGVNGSSLTNQSELFDLYHDSVDAIVWIFPWTDAIRAYATVGYLYPATFEPRFALVEAVDHAILAFWVPAFRRQGKPAIDFARPASPSGREAFFEAEFEHRAERNLSAFLRSIEQGVEDDIPTLVGVTPYVTASGIQDLPDDAKQILAQVKKLGASTLGLNSILLASQSESVFSDHVHYTATGHKLVGTAIGDTLRDWFPVHR
ncbi:MAG: hypothetical protein ACC655_01595 [Rhodothermia bacterium]